MFKPKTITPKKNTSSNSESAPPAPPTRRTTTKVKEFDDSAILDRLKELESKIGEFDQLKKSVKLAKTAWTGFRKSFRKLCDTGHPDRVTTLSVLDAFFELSELELTESGG